MNVTAKVQFFGAQAAGKDYRLAVYVVEDNIISSQQVTGSGLVSGYHHRNLLRATNGTDYKGEKINTSAAVTADQQFDKSYAITLNSSWNTANLKLIAVIWDVPASGKPTVVNSNIIR